jgi:hypothetical protein
MIEVFLSILGEILKKTHKNQKGRIKIVKEEKNQAK